MKEMSIPDVIRHMNHDFLNKLNLIQMYMELGKIDECKNVIHKFSRESKILSNIHQIKCPKLIKWIDTFSFCYPTIQLELESNVNCPIPVEFDERLANYLQQTILHVYENFDPFEEQHLTLFVESKENDFQITFDLKGKWDAPAFQINQEFGLVIETVEEANQSWKYIIRSK